MTGCLFQTDYSEEREDKRIISGQQYYNKFGDLWIFPARPGFILQPSGAAAVVFSKPSKNCHLNINIQLVKSPSGDQRTQALSQHLFVGNTLKQINLNN